MLTLINETAHEAELVRLALDDETMAAVVVIKSTYDLDHGRASLSPRPHPVLRQAAVLDGVELEPETVLGKAAVDVVAIGAAAGDGHTRSGAVGIEVGAWSSRLLVFGDRVWRRSILRWSASNPQPFDRIPITWAVAFGGVAQTRNGPIPHPQNPEGRGYVVDLDTLADGTPLPNVEDFDNRLERPNQLVPPRSFAPLPRTSPLRIDAARDDAMIAGVNKAVFNLAPPQHRIPELVGGERCELHGWEGLAATTFELPREPLVVEVHIGAQRYDYTPRIDTLCLLPSRRQVVVTRRSTFTYRYARATARAVRLRSTS